MFRSFKKTNSIVRFLVWFLIYLIGGFPTLVYAVPTDGVIVQGSGEIHEHTPGQFEIHQTTDKIVINWESFNIEADQSVIFLQPGTNSVALNNMLGSLTSFIAGNLTANGQLILYNPNGIHFSSTANINVGALIATTLGITEQDFIDGLYNFIQDPNSPLAAIINEGMIQVETHAVLLASSVENKGSVVASLGSVVLASGTQATMDFIGNGLINFAVTGEVSGTVSDKDGNIMQDRVSNTGLLQADGGQVIMSAKDADIQGTITTGTATTTILISDAGAIGLGNTSGDMTISDAELDLITAANIIIGDGTTGAITVDNISNTSITGTLTLITGSTVAFSNTASTFTNADLTVSSSGNITQGVALTVGGGTASFTSSSGSITLNNGGNDLGANLTLDTNNSFNVVTTSTLTDLTITVDSSNTSTYALSAGNLSTFTLTDNGSNVELGQVALSSGSLNLSLTTDSGDLDLATAGTVNLGTSGNLTIVSAGAITQTNALIVTGTSAFTVTGTDVLTLTNASNDFTGAVTLNSGTGAVQLTDSTATDLAASTLGGNECTHFDQRFQRFHRRGFDNGRQRKPVADWQRDDQPGIGEHHRRCDADLKHRFHSGRKRKHRGG